MFYETAQTVGPGWHRSYKPSHYEDMTWTPSNRHVRSPGSSPETYRRIIRNDDDFPSRTKDHDDEFFSGRKSPTFPRRVFKEVWNESPSSNHRFSDRPRMFKRVFRPDRWEDEFDRDIPSLRRMEREFDSNFDGGGPTTRKFDDEFEKRFNARDIKKDMDNDFEKSDGRVHHIPIMVERRMDQMKSRFGKNEKNSPPQERKTDEEYSEEWSGPQVQRLRKTFEQPEDENSRYNNYNNSRDDINSKPRPYTNASSESWDPHAIHTLPTRKAHKASQSFDDSRHPVPPKHVFRSYSETHDDSPRQQQPHSAAFRSHSDGHCPKQTHVTRIQVNLPSQTEKDELCSPGNQSKSEFGNFNSNANQDSDATQDSTSKLKGRNKYDNPAMQQIAVVLQNAEDLVTRVENYSGTGRDKHYRFLDEMLTRCMLRLDDVDTEGREDIRSARKAAVREVQNCIDRLEAKADESERRFKQSKLAPPKKDINASEVHSEQKKAIPLQAKENNGQSNPNQAIPLPAGYIEGEHVPQPNKAIPLVDKANKSEQNHQKKVAIPLGYTQDANNNQNIDNSKSESSNVEQTKL